MIKNIVLNNMVIINTILILLVVLGHIGCVYADKWNYPNSKLMRYITEYI
ncbi:MULTISPECIES: hypothetical protein [Clostridium]|nr:MULTISPECIES: hypothetical protein [Clostridium]MDI9217071.1 hypothetical protein [Clostridium tertium]